MALLTRTFQRGQQDTEAAPLLCSDDVFTVEPKTGDIWPNMVCTYVYVA